MTLSKDTVRRYIDGFNKGDHAQILSCLTDDIEWLMPGHLSCGGKARPLTEQSKTTSRPADPSSRSRDWSKRIRVVIAEGTVRVVRREGGFLNALFCDVFEMMEGKIKRLTTYQVHIKEQT
jgi:ketosteroid isomerase-like protein